MTQNEVYKLIRSINSCIKIYEEDTFYSVDSNDILRFEYCCTGDSAIKFVCQKDELGNFMFIEINENGVSFTKINKGGTQYTELDLSTEYNFFQISTVMDLGFSYDDLHEIRMNFLKFYNGLLNEITFFL